MDGYALVIGGNFRRNDRESQGVSPGRRKPSLLDTGDPMPEGMDCVVMSRTRSRGEPPAPSASRRRSRPWQNVRVGGRGRRRGPAHPHGGAYVLRPYDLGALLAAGITRECGCVGVRGWQSYPTGDELVEAGVDLKPGDLVEFNSIVMSAFIAEWGGEALPGPILEDKFEVIETAVRDALEERRRRSGERGIIRGA